jgi:hypothetical protein
MMTGRDMHKQTNVKPSKNFEMLFVSELLKEATISKKVNSILAKAK